MADFTPVLLTRAGHTTPYSVSEYISHGGYSALEKAVTMTGEEILKELTAARLMGRGGAGYPVDKKWRHLYGVEGGPKYVVCNADEGEPGTFKDRVLLEQDPLSVIEGMTIAGYLFGSPRGFIYIRGEYRDLQPLFERAVKHAHRFGYLGKNILDVEGFDFDITVVTGGGAYVCGENSAMLNSIEGKVGRPRVKPPHLAEVGLYGRPTLVNNVESFAAVAPILNMGGDAYHSLGTEFSGGTKLVSLCGHVKRPGTYEVPLGTPIRTIIEDWGGGTDSGRAVGFCQLGGHSGPIGFPEQLDTPYCYKAARDAGLGIGSGSIVVMDEDVDVVAYLQKVMEFFAHESCGKCTPCRLGTTRMLELLTAFAEDRAVPGDVERLERLADNVAMLSSCGLGQSADKALKSCLKHRRAAFEAHIVLKGGVS